MLWWAGLKQYRSLAAVIDTEENFNIRAYMYVPTGIHLVQLFEEMSLVVMLVPRSLVHFFFGVVGPMLLPFIFESEKGVVVSIILIR